MRFLAILPAVIAFTACGPTVRISRDASTRIAPAATWAWGSADSDGLTAATGRVVPDDSADLMITEAIEAALARRGFRRTRHEQADLIVHYHVGRVTLHDSVPTLPPTATDVRRDPPGQWGGFGRPEPMDLREVTWEEGTLIVDVLTSARGTVAWRGWISGEIPRSADRDPRPAIGKAVNRLLRDFP